MIYKIALEHIISEFDIKEEIIDVIPFGNGHINKTFLLKGENQNYILQKINTYAFPNVDMLVNNIYIVTSHLKNKGNIVLEFIRTKSGKLYTKADKDYYRLYVFIKDTVCHEEINDMELVEKAGKAFGRLHNQLSDLDANLLGEVIPDFHNTVKRYHNLLAAASVDNLNRLETCKKEYEIIKSYESQYDRIIKGLKNGTISHAVTHNDPKINNVLFDSKTEEVKSVIDLDTVMPGSVLYDFGDALRSLFTGDNEDSNDLSLLQVDEDIYTHYLKGYLTEMKNTLTKEEINLLPFSAFLLSMECGMRFLEDYLKGDVYFNTTYSTHNLVRARTQITLAVDIYNNLDRLNVLTKELLK